ncbi:MAG: hypothetical protein QM733_07090 [Ilumatobacteraceae bacterium]
MRASTAAPGHAPTRLAAATMAVLLAVVPLVRPVPVHGGAGAVTSNYRVELQGVSPSTTGLHVEIADVSGTLRLTWEGAGTVVVDGYDGEPYLRIDADGVARNVRSPATYLNQDRYARVSMPATADSAATPEWQRISNGRSVEWHDHRTHWMDVDPPPAVQADPSSVHVIIDRWQVPLAVDGNAVTIDGRLLWVPAPSAGPWWLLAVGVFLVVLGLLVTRWWRTVAVVAAGVGTVLFAVDGFGFLARNHRGVLPWVWAIGWPLAAATATVVLARQLRTRRERVPAAMAIAGVVIGVVGGIDRLDGISHSQVFTTLPDWSARAAAALSLGIGAALVARFLLDVVPAALTGRPLSVTGVHDDASFVLGSQRSCSLRLPCSLPPLCFGTRRVLDRCPSCWFVLGSQRSCSLRLPCSLPPLCFGTRRVLDRHQPEPVTG